MIAYRKISYFTERDPLSFPTLKQPQPFPEDLLVPIPVLEEPRTRWEKFRDEIVKELQKRRWRGGPGYYEDFRNWGEQYTPRNDEQAIQQIQVFKEGGDYRRLVIDQELKSQYFSGNCYKNTFLYAEKYGGEIVHGSVFSLHHGRMDHAWVEDDNNVIDPTEGLRMTKNKYYRMAKANPEIRYTVDELRKILVEKEHWGPYKKDHVLNKKFLKEDKETG